MLFGTVIYWYLGSYVKDKNRNHWRIFFSSSGNATRSISLQYQEIDVQIQALTDEDPT